MESEKLEQLVLNSKDLTILQIFKILINLKYKTIALFVTTFLSITGGAYMAGQSNAKQEAAVLLQSPFSMRIDLDGQKHDLENLTLLEDPTLTSPSPDTMMLSLRQIRSSFDIIPLGQVLAQTNAHKKSLWDWVFADTSIITSAYAKDRVFSWNSHEQDFKFKEKHVSSTTIHRYYSDGCVLQYNLDKNKRAIPSSFVWITRTH